MATSKISQPTQNKFSRFNEWLAAKITAGVATMVCAYIFAAIALISLPSALKTGDAIVIVSWVAQTFLQLVLLSIIMVGQNLASKSVEQQINETHAASLGEFELAKEARLIAHKELAELREIAADIHRVIKDLEGGVNAQPAKKKAVKSGKAGTKNSNSK